MPSNSVVTPARRDTLTAMVALLLVAGPFWAAQFHLGQPAYQYERVEVTTGDESAITEADESPSLVSAPVSESIACIGNWEPIRRCAFESHVADGATIGSGWHTSNAGLVDGAMPRERYQYVVVGEQVYETTYVANKSVRNDRGMYRIDVALEPASARAALDDAAIDAQDDVVPAPVREAARTGSATASRDAQVPPELIQVDDGRYYRVYQTGTTDPWIGEVVLGGLLTGIAPLAGLLWLVSFSRRIEVQYIGSGRR